MTDGIEEGIRAALTEAIEEISDARGRLAVLNRESRAEFPGWFRKSIWKRDSGKCWICGREAVRPVIDHIVARSRFPVDCIALADKSTNLHIACWDCNEEKSNRYWGNPRPIPVVMRCRKCDERNDDRWSVACWCVYCGPSHTWDDEAIW